MGEKEKVNFSIVGEEIESDPNKLEIDFFPASPGYKDHALLEILNIKPEFAGTVKISYKGPVRDNKDKLDEEITNLKSRVIFLEQKLRQNPNSQTSQDDIKELERLKKRLEELKVEQNKQSNNNNKKSNFPTGWVIGGGIAIAILLIAVVFLLRKKNNK